MTHRVLTRLMVFNGIFSVKKKFNDIFSVKKKFKDNYSVRKRFMKMGKIYCKLPFTASLFSGLYYKCIMIVIDAPSVVSK